MGHCDLCGSASDRLSRVEDLWGLGVSTMCEDAAACSGAWAPAFDTAAAGEPNETAGLIAGSEDPNETAVLVYGQTFNSLDKADPPKTRRLGMV